MPGSIRTRQCSRNALAALLVLAVLFAQWAGFIHRVVHAERMATTTGMLRAIKPLAGPATSLKQLESNKQDQHSCAAFDAAALGASLPMPMARTSALPGTAVLARWSAFISWDAPLAHFFSSRAPPLA